MPHHKKEKTRIGLDIGSFSIKYAELSSGKEKGENCLVSFGVRRPPGASKESLKAELNTLAKDFSQKSVNISISGPAVVVRYITLPKMKDTELTTSLQFEAEKYIPFNINEVILDHQILQPDAAGKMKVLLVAAKKGAIEERLELLKESGLNVDVIDVDSFALINAFSLNNPVPQEDKVKALLNIGESLSSIDIISRNTPYFTRDFLIGGKEMTKAISNSLNVDMASAQNLKHNPESRKEEIDEAIGPVLSNMADEIRLSLGYYENQFGMSVDEVYLSGGGSNQKDLVGFLNDNVGVTCQLWDPTSVLILGPGVSKEELEKSKHELPIAIGLALRE